MEYIIIYSYELIHFIYIYNVCSNKIKILITKPYYMHSIFINRYKVKPDNNKVILSSAKLFSSANRTRVFLHTDMKTNIIKLAFWTRQDCYKENLFEIVLLSSFSLSLLIKYALNTENFFRNLFQSTRNQIVFTIFRLIWNKTEVRLVPNQSENDKYNLISGWFYKISRKKFSVCIMYPPQK